MTKQPYALFGILSFPIAVCSWLHKRCISFDTAKTEQQNKSRSNLSNVYVGRHDYVIDDKLLHNVGSDSANSYTRLGRLALIFANTIT